MYFKEIYLYLAHNKLPSSKVGIRKVEALAEKNTYYYIHYYLKYP